MSKINVGILLSILTLPLLSLPLSADPPKRPGIVQVSAGLPAAANEQALINALRAPFLAGRDVSAALQSWFDGIAATTAGDLTRANLAWKAGIGALHAKLPALPAANWPDAIDAEFDWFQAFDFPGSDGCDAYAVRYSVDNLKLYAVLLLPAGTPQPAAGKTGKAGGNATGAATPGATYPLLLYLHGAAYGVPSHALPWLARHVRAGYAVVGPALRGEDLFVAGYNVPKGMESLRCEGQIENLDGEVNDALGAVSAAQKLPAVRDGRFAVIGHSFGAGAGLLVAARHADTAAVVSFDAWLTNPFRYYWDRMNRAANNWGSWDWFCELPVDQQLAGLMRRSITHHAEQINSPLLLFLGGAYAGSVFHLSHADFVAELRRYNKDFELDEVADGGHNFVLYYNSAPARYAFAKHMQFLNTHLPATPPEVRAGNAP